MDVFKGEFILVSAIRNQKYWRNFSSRTFEPTSTLGREKTLSEMIRIDSKGINTSFRCCTKSTELNVFKDFWNLEITYLFPTVVMSCSRDSE